MSEQGELFPVPPQSDADFVTVAQLGDIPEGQGRPFVVGARMVAVFNAAGHYYAIDDFCPHQGASLAGGFVEDCTVACPWHFWRFSIRDGSWLDSPRIKVDCFDVRVVGSDIQVAIEPRKTKT